ncbi:MAG TPA: hypothetical protein PKB11_08040 [Desulfovibrio sp.]|jgi:hypothetical protein|uniref:hypothetical protein n=1 Tax=Desulfovibrio TaxID=872 RepID=UPI002C2A8B92|nr:hypothetical protein [Desulfovibrio sp.]HMM38693.1 hypothetical protein [Desulfovibrio sp.]
MNALALARAMDEKLGDLRERAVREHAAGFADSMERFRRDRALMEDEFQQDYLDLFNLLKFAQAKSGGASPDLLRRLNRACELMTPLLPQRLEGALDETRAHRFLGRAATLLEAGDPRGALEALLPAADAIPDRMDAPLLLGRILDADPGLEDMARERLAPRTLFHAGRIRHDFLARCADLTVIDGRILAVGYDTPTVHSMDPDGGRLSIQDLGLRQAIGIFPGPDGTLWICDRGNARLVALGASGEVSTPLDFAASTDPFLRDRLPTWGAFADGALHLIVNRRDNLGDVALVRLPLSEGLRRAQPVDLPGLRFPHQLQPWGGGLALRDFEANALHRLGPDGSLTRLFTADTASRAFRFCPCGDDFFIMYEGQFRKYGPDGEPLLVSRTDAEGRPHGYLLGCHCALIKGRETLFVLDQTQRCIHVFRVDAEAWRERMHPAHQ